MNNRKDKVEITPLSRLGDQAENLDQKVFYEMTPFDTEMELYKTNLLHVIMDLVGKEMMRLTKLQRDILLRCVFKGESVRTVGSSMQLSHVAIIQAKSRAVATLKRRLAENPYFMQTYKDYQEVDPSLEVLNTLSKFLGK